MIITGSVKSCLSGFKCINLGSCCVEVVQVKTYPRMDKYVSYDHYLQKKDHSYKKITCSIFTDKEWDDILAPIRHGEKNIV